MAKWVSLKVIGLTALPEGGRARGSRKNARSFDLGGRETT